MPAQTLSAATWPLLGRTRELERIHAARTTGRCPGVVIAAAAGVGKSRLAREAVAAAEREGALVGWVQATRSAAAIPLAAFAELLPTDVRSDDLLELMRRSAAALRGRADGRPIVIGVDDAQSLDPTSAALVLQLVSTRVAFVVATVRSGDSAPDAITSLWKDAGALRLTLQPLDEADTTELVEQALGATVEQAAARWIYDSSQGNTLYVRELLLGALESGSLVRDRGLWRLVERPPLRESLGDLIAARMAGLAPDERNAIELLAFGEPLPLALVIEVTGSEPLAAAEAHRMIVVEPAQTGGTVRLAHPLYGEVVRDSLPESWARELRLRLAALVQAAGDVGPDDALRVARWLLDAGEPVGAPLLVAAGGAALQAGDADLGAELAALALADGASLRASLLLARAHAARKRYDEALLVLEEARDTVADQQAGLEYIEVALAVLYWGQRKGEELVATYEAAAGWFPDPHWQQRLEPLRLYALECGRPYGVTVEDSGAALAAPDLEPDVRRHLEAFHASDLFYAGRVREGLALSDRTRPALPLADATDEFALAVWAKTAVESGLDWPALEAVLPDLVRQAVRADDHVAVGVTTLALGGLRVFGGRYADAARWLAEAELRHERRDPFDALCVVRALQVVVAAAQGDRDGAEAGLPRCHDAVGRWRPDAGQLPYLARAEAAVQLLRGDGAGACELLLSTAEEHAPMPIVAGRMAYEAMRAGTPATDVLDDLVRYAAACDAALTTAYAAHAAGRAARDGGALLEASDTFAAIGADVFAMEAAAHAAEAFAAQGQAEAARRAAARCLELHAQGEGGSVPEIAALDPQDIALTSRERQLIDLAREGLTNAEIAQRLVLSVRTVESHLYRAMQKLGVSDRREL